MCCAGYEWCYVLWDVNREETKVTEVTADYLTPGKGMGKP